MQWIVPLRDRASEQVEIFQLYQISHDFYQEATYRSELDAQAEQYQRMVEQHQQELRSLRQDINLMGWFNRWLHG